MSFFRDTTPSCPFICTNVIVLLSVSSSHFLPKERDWGEGNMDNKYSSPHPKKLPSHSTKCLHIPQLLILGWSLKPRVRFSWNPGWICRETQPWEPCMGPWFWWAPGVTAFPWKIICRCCFCILHQPLPDLQSLGHRGIYFCSLCPNAMNSSQKLILYRSSSFLPQRGVVYAGNKFLLHPCTPVHSHHKNNPRSDDRAQNERFMHFIESI